jgi:hypothetical protein
MMAARQDPIALGQKVALMPLVTYCAVLPFSQARRWNYKRLSCACLTESAIEKSGGGGSGQTITSRYMAGIDCRSAGRQIDRRSGQWLGGPAARRTAHRAAKRGGVNPLVIDRVGELRPQLVTFNGHSFELPVLRYRAVVNLVSGAGLIVRP